MYKLLDQISFLLEKPMQGYINQTAHVGIYGLVQTETATCTGYKYLYGVV